MGKFKHITLVAIFLVLVGCSSLSLFDKPSPVILHEEDRYFTLKAGVPVELVLDGKPIAMTFSHDMKVVSPSKLSKEETKLNKALADKLQFKKEKNTWMAVITPLFGIICSIIVVIVKKKKFSLQGEINA